AVGTNDDEIAERFLFPGNLAADLIVDGHVAIIGNVKSNRVRRIVVAPVVPMGQIVMRRTVLFLRLLSLRLELLFRAIAAVSDAAIQQLFRNFVVKGRAL